MEYTLWLGTVNNRSEGIKIIKITNLMVPCVTTAYVLVAEEKEHGHTRAQESKSKQVRLAVGAKAVASCL